mmetsp:Transcript_6241/g.19530  ORF Transcript_6241/g.19530 Transcript_6241/m.19530 type:complete len:223 (+) Transcript_6241:295-963(+)
MPGEMSANMRMRTSRAPSPSPSMSNSKTACGLLGSKVACIAPESTTYMRFSSREKARPFGLSRPVYTTVSARVAGLNRYTCAGSEHLRCGYWMQPYCGSVNQIEPSEWKTASLGELSGWPWYSPTSFVLETKWPSSSTCTRASCRPVVSHVTHALPVPSTTCPLLWLDGASRGVAPRGRFGPPVPTRKVASQSPGVGQLPEVKVSAPSAHTHDTPSVRAPSR